MANCACYGRCVGVNNYTKKDSSPGCKLILADDSGNLLEFFGSFVLPNFPFGTVVNASFDISVFNGKIQGLRLSSVEEVKK